MQCSFALHGSHSLDCERKFQRPVSNPFNHMDQEEEKKMKTTVQIASDLHLDINKISLSSVIKPVADILILAGDICEVRRTSIIIPALKWAEEHFKKIYYIPGNHEFYGDHYNRGRKKLMNLNSEKTTVLFAGHDEVQLNEKWNLYGATFWSYIPPSRQYEVEMTATDFRSIHGLTISTYNTLHECEGKWLEQKLTSSSKHNLVVTHHPPTMDKSDPKYGGPERSLNWLFGSVDFSHLLSMSNVKWISGHTHYNIVEDNFASNQFGYYECQNYKPDFVLELK